MFNTKILSLACLVAFGSAAFHAAAAPSFYVVVPVKSRSAASPADDIVVKLSASSLPQAKVGKPYSQDLTNFLQVTGDPTYNAQSVAWSLASGTLPDGLTLGAAGLVAGTPSVISETGSTFEVIASYKSQSGQQRYTIRVGEAVLEVSQIAAGQGYTCAIVSGDAVKCWGSNVSGQLGDGTNISSNIPVQVSGLNSGVRRLAAGLNHTCAIVSGGMVKCWGNNTKGQLGNGTNTSSNTPAQVIGLSEVTRIAANDLHSCAIVSNGEAKCWGSNTWGQLGNRTLTDSYIPVQVTDLTVQGAQVLSIAVGRSHTCAIISGGAVNCWGSNSGSQLGVGATSLTFSERPMQVVGLNAGVNNLAAGFNHTCVIDSSEAVKCWGSNGTGQLGDGSTTNRNTPVQVSGLSSGMLLLAVGAQHSCGIGSGAVTCWGSNVTGQLGDGSTTNRSTPVRVSGLGTEVSSIAAAHRHTCAIVSGAAKCWGSNASGQLGDGTYTDRVTPISVVEGN